MLNRGAPRDGYQRAYGASFGNEIMDATYANATARLDLDLAKNQLPLKENIPVKEQLVSPASGSLVICRSPNPKRDGYRTRAVLFRSDVPSDAAYGLPRHRSSLLSLANRLTRPVFRS